MEYKWHYCIYTSIIFVHPYGSSYIHVSLCQLLSLIIYVDYTECFICRLIIMIKIFTSFWLQENQYNVYYMLFTHNLLVHSYKINIFVIAW